MTTIRVKQNESLESALKRFKRETSKAGLMAEIKKRKHYEKPSVIKKRKIDAAKRKRRKNSHTM
ncbi:30S ribosomal protein S21 [Guggenheimella bovis]